MGVCASESRAKPKRSTSKSKIYSSHHYIKNQPIKQEYSTDDSGVSAKDLIFEYFDLFDVNKDGMIERS
jgi:Ca2+-binding EF-hand superfamily protein